MTPYIRIGRFSGLSIPLLVAGFAALTVAGLAHSQDSREAVPDPLRAAAPATIAPASAVQESAIWEARPIRHGACIYSNGDDDAPMDDPDQSLRPRDRTGEPAQ